jgi:hypothetical protein
MASAFGMRYAYRPPGTPGKFARIMVGVDMAASVALAVAAFVTAAGDGVWTFTTFERSGPKTLSVFDAYPDPIDLILGLTYVVSTVAAVAWVVWQHRAQTNVWAVAGSERPRVSPGWAVGWWFVPIANWWMPFVAMRELHRRSAQTAGRRRAGGSATLGAWWAFWLASAAAGFVAGGMLLATLASSVLDADGASVVIGMGEVAAAIQVLGAGYVLRAASGILAIALIGDIDRAQAASQGWGSASRAGVPVPRRPDIA